jgi:hypothetical protein
VEKQQPPADTKHTLFFGSWLLTTRQGASGSFCFILLSSTIMKAHSFRHGGIPFMIMVLSVSFTQTCCFVQEVETIASGQQGQVMIHKNRLLNEAEDIPNLFPFRWQDWIGFACAVIGLMLAAGGGIGGGGVLLPIYILIFGFPVKFAIPLASSTVWGGAVANNFLNCRKKHPENPSASCIDWDLLLQLEPMTSTSFCVCMFCLILYRSVLTVPWIVSILISRIQLLEL